jgi:hypothetical protein
MLFLSDSPYLKLLFYTVSTIIKAPIITGRQFLYPLHVEHGRLWRQPLLHCFFDIIIVEGTLASKAHPQAQEQTSHLALGLGYGWGWWGLQFERSCAAKHCHEAAKVHE